MRLLLQWKKKTKSITYSECQFVALGIQHAMHMRHVICGQPRSTIFLQIISKKERFSKTSYRIWYVWVEILYNFLRGKFFILRRSERDVIKYVHWFAVHGSVHHNTNLIEITNKMQLCRTIYYSIVPWLLNMFRAILSLIIGSFETVITASGFTHVCRYRPLSWLSHDSGR